MRPQNETSPEPDSLKDESNSQLSANISEINANKFIKNIALALAAAAVIKFCLHDEKNSATTQPTDQLNNQAKIHHKN